MRQIQRLILLVNAILKIIIAFVKRYFIYSINLIIILLINDYILLTYTKFKSNLNININEEIYLTKNDSSIRKNFDFTDEFFNIKSIKEQIKKKNLTTIETISGDYGHLGNSLIKINNLISM